MKRTKKKNHSNSQDTISSRLQIHEADDNDMEIVVVSDTVRHRRSRTPQSLSQPTIPIPTNDHEIGPVTAITSNNMPDLLPKTFHLAESSSLFSQISDDSSRTTSECMRSTSDTENNVNREQAVSMVEIRETNLSTPKIAINTYNDGINRSQLTTSTIGNDRDCMELLHSPKVGEIVNAINIFESADYFDPECVETVHIIDATSETSDTDTGCSTPNIDVCDESDEDESGEIPQPPLSSLPPTTDLLPQMTLSKQRDVMHAPKQTVNERRCTDTKSSVSSSLLPFQKKFTPTLKEILSFTERDSFNASNVLDDHTTDLSLDHHRRPITVLASILLTQNPAPASPLQQIQKIILIIVTYLSFAMKRSCPKFKCTISIVCARVIY